MSAEKPLSGELQYWKETIEDGKLKLSENILDLANQISNVWGDLNFESNEFDYAFSLLESRAESLEAEFKRLAGELAAANELAKWLDYCAEDSSAWREEGGSAMIENHAISVVLYIDFMVLMIISRMDDAEVRIGASTICAVAGALLIFASLWMSKKRHSR